MIFIIQTKYNICHTTTHFIDSLTRTKPDLLSLDEPFSSKYVEIRRGGLSNEVRDILKHEKITAILVTHDQKVAFLVSDIIGIMESDKLIHWVDGYTLYYDPVNAFIADFIIGAMLFIKRCKCLFILIV